MNSAFVPVKICGLTREADVDAAVAAGAQALGFVLYPASPRAVTSTPPPAGKGTMRRTRRDG